MRINYSEYKCAWTQTRDELVQILVAFTAPRGFGIVPLQTRPSAQRRALSTRVFFRLTNKACTEEFETIFVASSIYTYQEAPSSGLG